MKPDDPQRRELSSDHRMLLHIRDTLYEGSWEDFVADIQARAESRPHVFDVLPPSARMAETIDRHLALIDELRQWEQSHGVRLYAEGAP